MGVSTEVRPRVLVVDDELRNRALLRAVLEPDHEVVEAESGEAALEVLARETIDLVLLDVMMAGLNGFDTCREIKRRHPEPYLPVLLLTALSDQESRVLGFEAGADDFLPKPFDRRELVLRTRAFLRLRDQDERIRVQLGEMRQLDQLKDDLAALVVHDLRNPLAGLDGLLWVLKGDAIDSDQRELLEGAMTASRHLRHAIDDMLKIRLIEQQVFELDRQPTSMRSVAALAVGFLDGDARSRGLMIELAGDDVVAPVDAGLVRRAVENLLANALRYTRPRTTVSVVVTGDGHAVEVAVGDRGPGIPDDQKREVFTKYASVEGATGLVRRGNGLGLYLVNLTAQAHGGEASVEDRPGGGALFRIRLPKVARIPVSLV